MSIFNNIQNALNVKLNSITGIPTIVWPNTQYVPAQGTSFIRPTLLPAKSKLYTLVDSEHSGIYQVDIFTTIKKGSAPLLTIADTIRDEFNSDLSLTSGGDTIFLQQISISNPQLVESWWTCYVEINYLCFN